MTGAAAQLLSSPPLVAGLLLAVLLAAVLALLRLRGGSASFPVVARPILTDAEAAFHRRLAQAVDRIGGLSVYPQMAMSAFLQPRPGLDRETHMAVFRRFSQKRPDFVLVDAAWRVRLIVELDDRTHDAQRDAERDRMTLSAGIRTVRISDARRLGADDLRMRLLDALNG